MPRYVAFTPGKVVPLNSTVIRKAYYDGRKKLLTLIFQGGATYNYFKVPKDTYIDLVNSQSCGVFFQSKIRGKFDFSRMTMGGKE